MILTVGSSFGTNSTRPEDPKDVIQLITSSIGKFLAIMRWWTRAKAITESKLDLLIKLFLSASFQPKLVLGLEKSA